MWLEPPLTTQIAETIENTDDTENTENTEDTENTDDVINSQVRSVTYERNHPKGGNNSQVTYQ